MAAKYKNVRSLLILVLVLSAVNVIFPVLGIYFMFYYGTFTSAFLSTYGIVLAEATGDTAYVLLGALLSAISVAPIIVCFVLSKKHKVGAMIASTILMGADTAFMALNFVLDIKAGYFESSMITGFIVHILVIAFLAAGISYAKKLVEEEKAAANAPTEVEIPAASVTEEPTEITPRVITVTRRKSFVGCAVPIVCYVNGNEVCRLKNGKSAEITVDSRTFELGAAFPNGLATGRITVPQGTYPLSFTVSVKPGLVSNSIVIEYR